MQISTVLDKIDHGAVALPEFQRGYVWRRPKVRELVESLYRRFPVGSLLLWQTATESAPTRGNARLQPGYVSLLLDGQQRITSLYALIRGSPPPFFDGDPSIFADLRFHVAEETFGFYAPVTMREDPLWIDVGTLLREGLGWGFEQLQRANVDGPSFVTYSQRLNQLYTIRDIELHDEEVTGPEFNIDVVVELFNRVNSQGTNLSKGDLALAKICASWPEARAELKARLTKWEDAGFSFTLDWLLRNVNAIVTGRSEFSALASADTATVRQGLLDAERAIDGVLNLTSTRLGLDHDRVLGGVAAIPLMSRFLADRDFRWPDERTAARLLFWYVHTLMWGRYSGSTETILNTDLNRIRDGEGDPLEALVAELRRSRPDLRVRAEDFAGSTRGARFYPLLYMLTRTQGARDLGSGLELSRHLLGQRTALEIHHIFPKAVLYDHGYNRPEVNALANFTFLTLETNRSIGQRRPAEYLPEMERRYAGVVASHWIPDDDELLEVGNYRDFLARRRELLAQAANRLLDDLWGGKVAAPTAPSVLEIGAVTVHDDEGEAEEIAGLRQWLEERGVRPGVEALAVLDLDGRAEEAIFDIAWPDGLIYGGERVALLLDEPAEVHAVAGRHGYRFFTSSNDLRDYVERHVLASAD